MSQTLIFLDDQAQAQTFPFGTTAASGEALVTINKGTTAASTVVLDVKGSQNIGGDLNLTGNLNITGNINESSVTNLKVTDKTITANVGGTSAGAAGAGLLIEGDSAAVIAKIIYDSSLGTKFKIGDGSTQAEIVDVSTSQILTNKTLTSPAITTPTGIVKGDVGLSNVDNTSDAAKPVSTATQTALNLKANAGANTDITSVLLNQTGLVVKGATANALTIKPNETLSGARTLSIVTGDTNRSITFSADVTIGGTFSGTSSGSNTGDQTISDATITTTDITTNNVTSTKHGFAPKSPADATKFLNGATTPAYANVQDSDLATTDITTNNFTTAKHGFVPKGTNVGDYLKDDGTWASVSSSTYTRFTTVSGTQDGANKVFTIGNAFTANTEMIYSNGQLLTPGSSNDYVISGTTLTIQAARPAPRATDVLRAYGNY